MAGLNPATDGNKPYNLITSAFNLVAIIVCAIVDLFEQMATILGQQPDCCRIPTHAPDA